METFRYGNEDAQLVLIQAVDAHDLAVIENEVSEIRRLTSADFQLIAVKTERWNHDLSPWKSPAVFGREPFGDGAEETLTEILRLTSGLHKTFLIGGYSLGAVCALGSLSDRCIQRNGSGISVRVVSGIHGIYEHTRNPQQISLSQSRQKRT